MARCFGYPVHAGREGGGSADVGCSEALGLVMGVDPEPRGREDVCEEPLGLGDRAGVDMVRMSSHASGG